MIVLVVCFGAHAGENDLPIDSANSDALDDIVNLQREGFDEKKIRNIIFHLDKLGKIKRINRRNYLAV